MIKELPKPDQFGSYWLDRSHKNISQMPAIFPSKKIVQEKDKEKRSVVPTGTYILTFGSAGFVFHQGGLLHRFTTAEEAMQYYNDKVK